VIKIRVRIEIALYIAVIFGGTLLLHSRDHLEWFYAVTRKYEQYNLDDLLLAIPLTVACLVIFAVRRTRELLQTTRNLHAANEELGIAYAQIEKTLQARDLFIAAASHELKSPLIIISNALQLMDEETDAEALKIFNQTAQEKARYGLQLVQDVLQYAQLTSASGEVPTQPCSPRDIVRTIFEATQKTAREKKLALSMDVATSVPETVASNAGMLRLICANLVNNAVKYTDSGQVEIACSHQAGTSPMLRFCITDSGQGIAKEKLHRVFNAFDRGDTPENTCQEGVGLGLYIVQQLVRTMHGHIDIKSTPDSGTVFTVSIPVNSLQDADNALQK